ncbi:hypothetical protein PSP6_700003 [Paraburkholderia tropica]|nr:hypothetical protein PSP6_700003 [Paraburkholderia tropica]
MGVFFASQRTALGAAAALAALRTATAGVIEPRYASLAPSGQIR